ncbi:protein kinase-like domain [Purpureocillium lilacinum]|uniref:Protein kinase-like domain n=1 Tax=Purpureocillium lilacinum TaxID=33203 RepID=A0A179HWQ0_PURLI|nr:protein kinase-like domain [Purpureocillium lilacinum]OAQ93908.1 protein kinase-like domain [Purpureocillium lilacinum]
MASFDAIAVAHNDKERGKFIRKLIDERDEIVAFVDHRLGWGGAGQYSQFLKGSFNISFVIENKGNGYKVLIRFPLPGRTYEQWREEKVRNEVMVIAYLREHTTIPLPRVLAWGLAGESPEQLGPFIIMEFIKGIDLDEVLKQPTENDQEEVILNPDIDEASLDIVYDQIAEYMVQLSRLRFPRIGAVSDNTSWHQTITGRPLTFDMNELVTNTGYPADKFPSTPFDRTRDYFEALSGIHFTHLWSHRNLATSDVDARWRFLARHRFRQLIPKYCNEGDSFRLFGDDFRPANILVDPVTFKITAVLDFEFTNAMPAQFTYDPPWWLLLLAPHIWLERDKKEEFLRRFVPRMEQFIRAVERAEARSSSTEEPFLSTRMRNSWKTGQFWFDYAARRSMDVDVVYWHVLHRMHGNEGSLDKETRDEMEDVVQMKMKQFKAYEEEELKGVQVA